VFIQTSAPSSSTVHGGVLGFGKNMKSKLIIMIIIVQTKNGLLLQIGFLNGFATPKAITVITYCHIEMMKRTESSYDMKAVEPRSSSSSVFYGIV